MGIGGRLAHEASNVTHAPHLEPRLENHLDIPHMPTAAEHTSATRELSEMGSRVQAPTHPAQTFNNTPDWKANTAKYVGGGGILILAGAIAHDRLKGDAEDTWQKLEETTKGLGDGLERLEHGIAGGVGSIYSSLGSVENPLTGGTTSVMTLLLVGLAVFVVYEIVT
jgi:hypothetical protein